MRRIGVLGYTETTRRVDPILQGLQHLGWADGRNIRIDIRLGAGNVDAVRKYAAEKHLASQFRHPYSPAPTR